jgi:hypothetical protein
MPMNKHQRFALDHHCRLSGETIKLQFRYTIERERCSIVLTVNSGYE